MSTAPPSWTLRDADPLPQCPGPCPQMGGWRGQCGHQQSAESPAWVEEGPALPLGGW